MIGSTLSALALASLPLSVKAWTKVNDYSGSSFFDGWSFFTDADPTHGLVSYVQDSSLAYVDGNGMAIIKVDDQTDVASGSSRKSTRITSNAAVNENSLVIMSATHLPSGCATWPAFWMVGPDWPNNGEVDIFEGVNLTPNNAMTLHTSSGCSHDSSAQQTGTAGQTDCNVAVNGNTGCGVQSGSNSYGDGVNNAGGGIWATQWVSDGIFIWFWNQGQQPADVDSDSPDPNGWGTPAAAWLFTNGQCSSSFFNNLNLVFDITLCGDWAGAVYDTTCGGGGSCADEVATGANFHDAYFSVKYVRTFSQ